MARASAGPERLEMGLTRAEQETVIRWDEDEQIVHIWSASPVTWRKMARLGVHPARETTAQGQPAGKVYTMPLGQFSWRLKRKAGSTAGLEAMRRARGLNQGPPGGQAGAEGAA